MSYDDENYLKPNEEEEVLGYNGDEDEDDDEDAISDDEDEDFDLEDEDEEEEEDFIGGDADQNY